MASVDIKKLVKAIDHSRMALKPFRQNRVMFIKEIAGSYYDTSMSIGASSGEPRETVIVNILALGLSVLVRQLVAQKPQVLMTTPLPNLKSFAYTSELAMNHLLEEILFGETMKKVVTDAGIMVGIVKVGMNYSGKFEINGTTHDVGQVYVDPIFFDDWFHDVNARSLEEAAFMGNIYKMPLDQAREIEYWNSNKKKLQASEMMSTNKDGDEKADNLSGEPNSEYQDYVILKDVFLPQTRRFLTMTDSRSMGGDEDMVLFNEPWEGPENGPYHFLGFQYIPGNIMPGSPIRNHYSQSRIYNDLYCKIGDQAERQKRVGLTSNKDDAITIMGLRDGDVGGVDNPEAIEERSFGGVDQGNIATSMFFRNIFSWSFGNLESLGGLAPQSGTATQDQMLRASSSTLIDSMQDATASFMKKILKDVYWYLWNDPYTEIPLVKRIQNTDITIPVTFSAEEKEGDFLDYNIDIHPYSTQFKSPQQSLSLIMQLIQGVYMPLAPIMEGQGISLNIQQMTDIISRYGNLPELKEIIQTSVPSMREQLGVIGAEGQKTPDQPRQAAVTSRTNVRENISGVNPQAQDAAILNAFAGSQQTPSPTPEG